MKLNTLIVELDNKLQNQGFPSFRELMEKAACGDLRERLTAAIGNDLAPFLFDCLNDISPDVKGRTLDSLLEIDLPSRDVKDMRSALREALLNAGAETVKPTIPEEDDAQFRKAADTIPIPDELLYAPQEYGQITKTSVQQIGTGNHLKEYLYGYLYRTAVFRASRDKTLLPAEEAERMTSTAIEKAIIAASQWKEAAPSAPNVLRTYQYERSRNGHIVDSESLRQRHFFIFDPQDHYFPFTYYLGEKDVRTEQTPLRAYISIHPSMHLEIGQYFVELLADLQKAGVRIIRSSKANGPAVIPVRLDNMILTIGEDQRAEAESVIADFLKARQLGQGHMLLAQESGIEGLSWMPAPDDVQSRYAQHVLREERIGYNQYAVARIAPHFIRRILKHIEETNGDKNAATLLRYELQRIGFD